MHVHTHLQARKMCPSHCKVFFFGWDVVLIPLEGARPPPPIAPTSRAPIPPPPLLPCPILPHFIALLNADNWWQMDCTAHCASVALGVGGGLGAGKEGRGGRERGVLAAARRLAQVAENQYRSGLWLGLTAQEQWSVGIHWVPHTAKLDDGAEEMQRGEGGAKTCYSALSQWHLDRVTRTLSKRTHT